MIAPAKEIRTGAAATEFAVALPLLMLLALAAADFGRAMHHYQIVSNAARTGSEAGAMHKVNSFTRDAWEADVRNAVLEELANLPGFNESFLEFVLNASVDANGLTTIELELVYPFTSAVNWPALPHTIELRKRSVIRQFR